MDTGRAMSQENVEVIRARFEFWRDGRTGEWIETLSLGRGSAHQEREGEKSSFHKLLRVNSAIPVFNPAAESA